MKLNSRLSVLSLSTILALAAFGQPAETPAPAAAPPARFQLPATDAGLPGAGPLRRNEWFQQIWTERRALFAEHAAQDQGALVFLGDSIMQGWNEDFRNRFPGVKLANRGVGGDTTRGVLLRLDEDVIALHPSGVVLLIGTNDIEDQADPDVIAANVKLILAKLKAYNPKMPIIFCQVFPSSATKKRPADRIKKLNQACWALVKGDPQITLLETWTLFANAQGDATPENFYDLVHLNEAGYRKWAAALHPLLATLGYLENEPDSFTPEPGFVSLFNGHDLTGWGFRPNSVADVQAANRWQKDDPNAAAWPMVSKRVEFDGLTASPDGRFVAKNGRLIVTTPPEGRRIQQISTTRDFATNFILKLEFRATPNADSGIFIRRPQLQCRDYLIAGPYKQLKKYKPQDWNEIVVAVTNDVAYCTCNGEVLEAALEIPSYGPIGLEGDRGQMEYRRIRLQEFH